MEIENATLPAPELDELNTPYWEGLKQGRLQYQHCNTCSHNWLPARSECPNCLQDKWCWLPASGAAKLISWVVYHMAYHPALKDRLPYAVGVIELAEGPRLISNVVGTQDFESLQIDQALQLTIEMEGETALPRFKPLTQTA
jgi:hypothetical protein